VTRSGKLALPEKLALAATFAALLALTACAKPGSQPAAQTQHDDTRGIDHPDRGMRDSHTM
jgi:hypothetical protein